MNAIATNRRFLVIVVMLAALMLGQVDYARADHCTRGVPQWAKDRQQYETSYVYEPPVSDLRAVAIVQSIPQWVLDRQQYETSYIHVPLGSDVPLAEIMTRIPQWAIDRQQYETGFVYVPAPRVKVSYC